MRWWDIGMDVVFTGTWGFLFYRLLGLLNPRAWEPGKRERCGELLVCMLPIFLWQGLLGYCKPVRAFFYGGDGLTNSSSTIVTNGITLLVFFGCGCFLYLRKSRISPFPLGVRICQVLYLTLLFGALSEMMRFGMYGLGGRFFSDLINHFCEQVNEGSLPVELFNQRVMLIQTAWNTLYFAMYLTCLAAAVHWCRKIHLAQRLPRGWELLYLTVPSLISLCFGILMRSIMLMTREGELHSIYEDTPGLYLLTPLICALCVGMILGSIRIWSRIVGEEREKSELLIYQSRVEDMEQYVGDLERMQEGLSGMKHDIKNYMADIQALMNLGEDETVQRELSGYLAGMERTLEECEIHYKSGNPVTDVLLNRHMQQARELQIAADWSFYFPVELRIDPFDMSIILNNGLNNALESCRKLPKEQRWIRVNGRSQGHIFLLEIRNAFGGFDRIEPGQGMRNMMRCARKYRGHMEWEQQEGEFRLTVLLQAGPESAENGAKAIP